MGVIGRERELGLVESFLDAGAGMRALHLLGEPGIGKTTLWHAALDGARRRGYRVVTTRPTEAEARLPFAGLNDLFGELVDLGRPSLPPPQAAALDVALMRADVEDEPIRPLALSLAVLELLRLASAERPLALGIDDLQWLDESSAGVVRFALRRLESEPVLLIATQRTDATASAPGIAVELPAERIVAIPVEALGIDDLEELLDETLGLRLAPTMVRRVHRMSGGNPFYAVEIGRALQARGMERGHGRVPLPESLTGLLRGRLGELGSDAREVVTHATALAQPTVATLEALLGRDRARSGLAAARSAAVLAADDGPVRFMHPLLAAEAYAMIDGPDRRELHRRLATVVGEPEELARHLALAATGPDAEVAAALDDAATHARARGAPDAAAELSELAAGLTPAADPARARRMAAAGRNRLMAGDVGGARQLLERSLDERGAASGRARAEVLLALAQVRQLMDDFGASATIARQALRHARDDAALTVEIKLFLAGVSHITGRGWAAGARHAAEAMRLAEQLGDQKTLAGTIGHYASWRYATGHGLDPDLERRASELEPWTRHLRTMDLPDFDFANIRSMEGDTRNADAGMRALLGRAERDGDYSSLPFLLGMVAWFDFLDGHADVAQQRLERALRLSEVTEQATAKVHNLVCVARVHARLGNAEPALAAARDAFDIMAATGWRVAEWLLRADLALLELSRGDPVAALEVAEPANLAVPDDAGRRHEARATSVEAFVALGRLDEARTTLRGLEARARRQGSRRLRADALRARARLLTAAGDAAAADSVIAEAEALHRSIGDRWELARTLLAAGEIHRRLRRRARAGAVLREALEGFELLGAGLWAAQAREQLGRIGGAREAGGLTPTQREVAELVASGMTNRQVADRLFMSAHTVEAHLSAIYRELEIRSRVELDAALTRQRAAAVRDSEPVIRDSAGLAATHI